MIMQKVRQIHDIEIKSNFISPYFYSNAFYPKVAYIKLQSPWFDAGVRVIKLINSERRRFYTTSFLLFAVPINISVSPHTLVVAIRAILFSFFHILLRGFPPSKGQPYRHKP